MERSIFMALTKMQPRGVRRGFLAMLAFVYLFVGIAHNVACLDHAVASSVQMGAVAMDGVITQQPVTETAFSASHDDNAASDLVLCDHCPTCVSAVMPAPVAGSIPCGVPVSADLSVAALLAADHGRLDTPPPKILT